MPAKILVVDDEANIATVFKDQLTIGGGYEVDVAPGGREALEMLKTTEYDLMLLDLVMPEMDGISVLQAMNDASLGYNKAPVIILTNVTSEEARKETTALGVKEYIVKTDVDPIGLLNSVRKALGEGVAV